MNANTAPNGAGLPIGAVAVNATGALLLAAGLVGLVVPDIVKAVPALADPTTAWSLIGAGLVLDIGAAVTILNHVRARKNRSVA